MKRMVAAALIGAAIALAAPAALSAPATDKAATVFAGADVIKVGHSSGDRRADRRKDYRADRRRDYRADRRRDYRGDRRYYRGDRYSRYGRQHYDRNRGRHGRRHGHRHGHGGGNDAAPYILGGVALGVILLLNTLDDH